MMDGLGLGSVNNLGPVIMSIIGVGLSAIILLTFAPTIAGDISAIALQGKTDGYCSVNGESTDRLVKESTSGADANTSWRAVKNTAANAIALSVDSSGCQKSGGWADGTPEAAATGVQYVASSDAGIYFTPQGERVSIAAKGNVTAAGVAAGATDAGATDAGDIISTTVGRWQEQSDSLGAGGLGTLIQLLFGAMGLMLPAGALGFMSYTGSKLVSEKFGGGLLTSALVVVVGVVVVGAILPQIIEPLDTFFLALDGNRFYIFSTGIGKLASTLGNFMGISLIAGVIALGGLLWKGKGGSGSGSFA